MSTKIQVSVEGNKVWHTDCEEWRQRINFVTTPPPGPPRPQTTERDRRTSAIMLPTCFFAYQDGVRLCCHQCQSCNGKVWIGHDGVLIVKDDPLEYPTPAAPVVTVKTVPSPTVTSEVAGGDPTLTVTKTLPDGAEERHTVVMTDPIMQFFAYAHLPAALQEKSKPFCELALWIVKTLPRNPERTVALRKLLEAKDAAVRAFLFK